MKILKEKRCIIGEGPIWNERDQKLYFTNGFGNEICIYDFDTERLETRSVKEGCAAFCFDTDNNLIVSRNDGVFILNDDNTVTPIYDTQKYNLKNCNDMKVGPDGAIYVGTLSSKTLETGNESDGKLYRIDKSGDVRIILDELVTPNGMDWSIDESKFYYVGDQDNYLKEYDFDKKTGNVSYTGRFIKLPGVDGITIDNNNNILAACWGGPYIARINTIDMTVKDTITPPLCHPASCSFAGKDMDMLVVTTSSYMVNLRKSENSGFTFILEGIGEGRKPYLFKSI